MEIIIIVSALFLTFGYIILSSPGDTLRKKHSLFRTSLKSNSIEDENVYEFLKENNVKSCFLDEELSDMKKIDKMILSGQGLPPIGEVKPLSQEESKITKMILNGEGIPPIADAKPLSQEKRKITKMILNGEGIPPLVDDDYSMFKFNEDVRIYTEEEFYNMIDENFKSLLSDDKGYQPKLRK